MSLCARLITVLTLIFTTGVYAAQPVSTAIETDGTMTAEPAADASAQPVEGIEPGTSAVEETPAAVQLPVDLKAAAEIALNAFGGEVLKAEEVEAESGLHFHIRVVNSGRVRDVVIDAANGDIVKPIETEVSEGAQAQ